MNEDLRDVMERHFEDFKKDSKETGEKVQDSVQDHGQNFGGIAGGTDTSKLQSSDENSERLMEQAKDAFNKRSEEDK